MQVTIDQAGRIVIPKAVRDHFGLRKDSTLELEERADGFVLKPVGQEATLVRRRNGRLMIVGTGGVVTDDEIRRIMQETRDERFACLNLDLE